MIESNDTPRHGFSLSGMFVLMTACAALVGGFAPLVQLAGKGQVDIARLLIALGTGFFGGMFLGLLVGLLQFRITVAAPIGAAAGALIGLSAGLFALLPQEHLGTSAITTFVGSGLVVGVALIHRRING
jgi:hypothetical protein